MKKQEILNLIKQNSEDFTVYRIPKKSGGLRTIFALHANKKEKYEELKRELELLEPHENAVAYRKNHTIKQAVEKHKEFQWHYKFDFSDFFPSCTFEHIYPIFRKKLSGKNIALMFWDYNRRVATQQGHPTSPAVSNLVMKPFDTYLTNTLNKKFKGKFAYTRYADDILISTHVRQDIKKLEKDLKRILKETKLNFLKLNSEKTAEMNRKGKVYFLGVCISNQGELTLGHAKRKTLINAMHAIEKAARTEKSISANKLKNTLNQIVYYNSVSNKKLEIKRWIRNIYIKTMGYEGYRILSWLNSQTFHNNTSVILKWQGK